MGVTPDGTTEPGTHWTRGLGGLGGWGGWGGYSGSTRPTESATQQGFSLPSTSTVKRVTT